MARCLWRENGSVVYSCCWFSPAQSFTGPSPEGFVTIIYCLRFETPPTWRARSLYLHPPRTEWPTYTPRYWVPFSSPPTTRRATVEVFESATTRGSSNKSNTPPILPNTSYKHFAQTSRNTTWIFDEACLPHRCLTVEVLLLRVRVFAGMSLYDAWSTTRVFWFLEIMFSDLLTLFSGKYAGLHSSSRRCVNNVWIPQYYCLLCIVLIHLSNWITVFCSF
jgi:hypothetical protein